MEKLFPSDSGLFQSDDVTQDIRNAWVCKYTGFVTRIIVFSAKFAYMCISFEIVVFNNKENTIFQETAPF